MSYEYEGPRTAVTITRRIAASPERVFDAWVEPALASRWLLTTPTSSAEHVLDPRVGGSYTITRRSGDNLYVTTGEYQVVERPSRLVFTFGMPQFTADIDTVTVTIEPLGNGSVLTLTQEGLRPGYEEMSVDGWEKMFDLLAQSLE